MKRSFSFTEKPVLFILKVLPTLLPGIEKVVAVYWSPDSKNTEAHILKKEDREYITEPLHITDSSSIIKRFRQEKAPYTWLRTEDLPFDVKIKEKVQLSIFNEVNNNVLLIRINNRFDENNDLFFFYFNQDLSNFGTVNPNKLLSTDNKTIIAHLIRDAIIAHLNILSEDREVYAIQVENTRQILNEASQLKKSVGSLTGKLKEGILQLCFSYLNEISGRNSRKYTLSESAVARLQDYQGNLQVLNLILEKAAAYADTMAAEDPSEPVLISDFHIFFNVENEQKVPEAVMEHVGEVPVKYLKTLQLLNRLENAAMQLKSQNKVLTSQNLGNEFPKPISPPAITDALKKHRPKILFLFKEFPNRWQVIRNEFRPVQNILNAKAGNDKLSATG